MGGKNPQRDMLSGHSLLVLMGSRVKGSAQTHYCLGVAKGK